MSLGVISSLPSVGESFTAFDFNTSQHIEYVLHKLGRNEIERIIPETGEVETVKIHVTMPNTESNVEEVEASVRTLNEDAPASSLGNSTNNVSEGALTIKTITPRQRKFRQGYRRKRYRLREVSASILSRTIDGELKNVFDERIAFGESPSGKFWRTCCCGRIRRKGAETVDLHYLEGRAHYKNLVSCGSVWTCPTCAAKICRYRAEQITKLITNFKKKYPNGRIALITYTLQHSIEDSAVDLFSDLKSAMRTVNQGEARQNFVEDFKVDGYVRGCEFRANLVNGHHPHAHELLLIRESDLTDGELVKAIDSNLGKRYRNKLGRLKYETNEYTFDVRLTDGSESYLTKFAGQLEITQGQNKESKSKTNYTTYSPFQLLDEYEQTGDERLARLFSEYAIATFRKRMVTFTTGLLDRYGVNDMEDKEIIDDKIDVGETVLSIPIKVWIEVLRCRMDDALLDAAEQYEGNTDLVANWMVEQGLINWCEIVKPFPPPKLYEELSDP